jgi:hypothetical protein
MTALQQQSPASSHCRRRLAVVVDIDIRLFAADRRELEPEGVTCLVTREIGEHWDL